MVFVLALVTLTSMLDRQLPTLLVGPIKQSLAISDTQFGLLQGLAFALFYSALGVPFGRLVDHTNRRNLILGALLLWSSMCLLAGFAATYWQLFVTRLGVGVGEAALAPAAYSMIADCFATRERGRAIGGYYLSLALGAGISILVGGVVLPLLPADGLDVPPFGRLPPWRLMFVLAGLPGLLIAPMLLTIKEPVRREADGARLADQVGSLGDFPRYLRQHAATSVCTVMLLAMVSLVGYSNLAWAPAFFERSFKIAVSHSGPVLGLILCSGGVAGALTSGILSDRWVQVGIKAARFKVVLWASVLMFPAAMAWALVPWPLLSYLLLAVAVVGASLAQAAGPTIIQEIVPNRMRGQAVASYLLIAGITGLGLGPAVPGLLTDHLFHNPQALGPALAVVAFAGALVAMVAAALGIKPYARSWAAVVGTASESTSRAGCDAFHGEQEGAAATSVLHVRTTRNN